MDRITAITPLATNGDASGASAARAGAPALQRAGRAVVKVDGRTAATLSLRSIEQLGLAVGQEWDAALAARVAEAVAFEKALNDAVRRIARRVLSQAEVRAKLEQAGHAPARVERTLARLRELGLVDDAALGRALIEELTARRGAGPALLRSKLAQRGLEDTLIEQLIEPAAQPEGALEQATALARGKLPALRGLDPATQKRRLWGLLSRRGFDEDTVARAIQGLVAPADEAAPGGSVD